MNKQRKVLITITYNEMGIIIDTKAEEVAQPQPCEDDPRADVYYLAEKIGINRLYTLVVALRGEPESCEDTISRQAVLDWLKNEWNGMVTSLFDGIKALPSAQPEIIYCKDCVYYRWETDMCDYPYSTAHNVVHEYDYCSKAKRRTDE